MQRCILRHSIPQQQQPLISYFPRTELRLGSTEHSVLCCRDGVQLPPRLVVELDWARQRSAQAQQAQHLKLLDVAIQSGHISPRVCSMASIVQLFRSLCVRDTAGDRQKARGAWR
jgi:hypothetical protein